MFDQRLVNDGIRSYVEVTFLEKHTLDHQALSELKEKSVEGIVESIVIREHAQIKMLFPIGQKVDLRRWVGLHGKLSTSQFRDVVEQILKLLSTQTITINPYYFILSPENIYLELGTGKVSLLYIPDTVLKTHFHGRLRGMFKALIPSLVNVEPTNRAFYGRILDLVQEEQFCAETLMRVMSKERVKTSNLWHWFNKQTEEKVNLWSNSSDGFSEERADAYLMKLTNSKKYPLCSNRTLKWVLGRNLKNDIVINEGVLNDIHATVYKKKNSYFVVDLETVNGTRVNGIFLKGRKARVINEGDILEFGDQKYVFYVGNHPKSYR